MLAGMRGKVFVGGAVLALVVTTIGAASASYAPPAKYAKRYSHTLHSEPTGSYEYWTYTPSTYRARKPAPLVVVVHGCNTTAMEQINANAAEAMAEREGIVLMYPDFRNELDSDPDSGESTNDSLIGAHPVRCWRSIASPTDSQRDVGDPAAVAHMTQQVMRERSIDPNRVYVVGMSSGGALTSVLGATYPDLFAAIGVIAGCAYLDAPLCAGRNAIDPDLSEVQARAAVAVMGSRKRVLPVIDIQGDDDGTVSSRAGYAVLKQWMATANLVRSGGTSGPFPLTPTATATSKKPGGRTYTTHTYRDPAGCLIGQHIVVPWHGSLLARRQHRQEVG